MTDPILPEPLEVQQRFEELFRRHAPAVFRYANKLLNGESDRANEIVQEVFTAVWIQFGRDFQDKSADSALPMIIRIATRRVHDHMRRRSTRVVLVSDYIDDHVSLFAPTGRKNPLDLVLSAMEEEHFWIVMANELTEAEFQIAISCWKFDLSDAEVSENMGIAPSTVRSHKSRARLKIQAIVARGEHRISNHREFEGGCSNSGKSSGGGVSA
ncbi:RNA polymerase sigma factor [Nocardia sp. NPDC047654]|uniref:RNA polymerase sigma factor n=1 Tax=Nocardia sp. NPDC047654 TaxID=3364314 RepID=UPI0037135C1C